VPGLPLRSTLHAWNFVFTISPIQKSPLRNTGDHEVWPMVKDKTADLQASLWLREHRAEKGQRRREGPFSAIATRPPGSAVSHESMTTEGWLMTARQRDSFIKYLYDLSKGFILIGVVSPWVTGAATWVTMVLGLSTSSAFFLWAYWMERDL
jgi:hypothetical protein